MRSYRLSGLFSALVLVPALAFSANSASADPKTPPLDGETQTKTVDELYREAEIAGEEAHGLRVEADELEQELLSLQADLDRQALATEDVREVARDIIVRQYTSGAGVSEFAAIVDAGGPGDFIERLSTQDTMSGILEQRMNEYETETEALTLREEAVEAKHDQAENVAGQAEAKALEASELYSEAKAQFDAAEARKKAAAEARALAAAQAQVEAEQAEVQAREPAVEEPDVDLPDVKASGRAAKVLSFARAQLNDAYVYGAAGPDAWDCSGLTMAAWGAAGVSLPHSSSAQSSMGTPVEVKDLQPGDLVFYYSPVSHVGIYAGDGMIIHAANPGSGVTTAPLMSMPYSGARRVA